MSALPVVIREEYLKLMDGDHCAAAILNAFEMWSRNKVGYIYKSVPDMQNDLMGLFGLNRIGEAFKKLRQRGFLLARNNPSQPTDRTLQYQFQPVLILWAAFKRFLSTLKPQPLALMLHALILKAQTLGLNDESESVSENQSKGISKSPIISDGGERDYPFEGVDPEKFRQDDPIPNPDGLPPYLRQQPPSIAIRQQLATYSQQLGVVRYAETMNRCANARSWEYVLKALANEIPSPRSAPPPSTGDTTEQDDIAGNDTPEVDLEGYDFAWLKAMKPTAHEAVQ